MVDAADGAGAGAGRAYAERRSALLPGVVWTGSTPAGPSAVLPDGCMDLIWDGERILVAGPDTGVARHRWDRSATLAAVRFDPGVAPTLLGMPAATLTDQRVDLTAVLAGDGVRRLTAALHEHPAPARVLERWSAARLDAAAVPQWIVPVVRRLAAGHQVAAVAHWAGVTPRQLGRWSAERFGYGPKVLQRVLRMVNARAVLGTVGDLSEAAHRAGYADYAHMFREFRALTDAPPTAFTA